MTFAEWADQYGIDSARGRFRLSSHLVFTVRPGHSVFGRCGRWMGSEPLGTGQSVESAKQKLRDALCNTFDTEETIQCMG